MKAKSVSATFIEKILKNKYSYQKNFPHNQGSVKRNPEKIISWKNIKMLFLLQRPPISGLHSVETKNCFWKKRICKNCFNCLSTSHSLKKRQSKFTCHVDNDKQKHHLLLHITFPKHSNNADQAQFSKSNVHDPNLQQY